MAAPALAQSVVYGGATSGTTASATFGSNTTTGNTYLVVSNAYGGASLINVTSSGPAVSAGSATFSKITSQVGVANAYGNSEAWIAYNITGGTTPTITCTYSGTITAVDIAIYEWTNVFSIDGTPVTGTGTNTGGSDTLGALTTTNANDVLFALCATANFISSVSSGWPGTPVFKEVTNNGSGLIYDIVTATVSGVQLILNDNPAGATFGYIEFALSNVQSALHPSLTAGTVSVSGSVAVTLNIFTTGSVSVTGSVSPLLPTPNPITFVQQTTFVSPNVGFNTLAQTAGDANFLEVIVAGTSNPPTGSGGVGTPGDSVNGHYTLVASAGNTTVMIWLYAFFGIAAAGAGVNQIVITTASGATAMTYVGQEFSSVSNILDGSAIGNTGTGTAPTASLTATNATDLLLSFAGEMTGTGTVTGGSGYTSLWTQTSGPAAGAQYKITTATGTFSGNFTVPTGSWTALQVAFTAQTKSVIENVSGLTTVTAVQPTVNLAVIPSSLSGTIALTSVLAETFNPVNPNLSGTNLLTGVVHPVLAQIFLPSVSGNINITGLPIPGVGPLLSGVTSISGVVTPNFSPIFLNISGSVLATGAISTGLGPVTSGIINIGGSSNAPVGPGINNLQLAVSTTSGTVSETGVTNIGLGISLSGLFGVSGIVNPTLPVINITITGSYGLTGIINPALNPALGFSTPSMLNFSGIVFPTLPSINLTISGTANVTATVIPALIFAPLTGSNNITGSTTPGISPAFTGSIAVSGSVFPVLTPIFITVSGAIVVTGSLQGGKGLGQSLIGVYDFWGGGFC